MARSSGISATKDDWPFMMLCLLQTMLQHINQCADLCSLFDLWANLTHQSGPANLKSTPAVSCTARMTLPKGLDHPKIWHYLSNACQVQIAQVHI